MREGIYRIGTTISQTSSEGIAMINNNGIRGLDNVNLPRFDGHGNSKKERGPDGSKTERAPGVYGAIQKPGSGDGDPQR
jgi:hypothetical protein